MTGPHPPPVTPAAEATRQRADPPAIEARSSWMTEAAALGPALLLLTTLLLVAAARGATFAELLAATFTVLLTQLLPGVVIWRAIRPVRGWWIEDIAVGFAIGAGLAVPAQVAAVASSVGLLGWVLPVALTAGMLALPKLRVRILGATCVPLPRLWGTGVGLATLLPALTALRFFDEPLRWTGWAVPYVDLPYHLALSGEVAHRWPLHYPQVAAESLHYHWFSHAWIAQVSGVSGVPLDVVLLRFMPALLAVMVPLATAAVALRVSGRPWAGPLAAAIAFAFVELDVWHVVRAQVPITPLSPTQGFGVLLLLATLALLVVRWREKASAGSLVLLVLLLVLTGGAKGTTLPVLVCGCALAIIAAWRFQSSARWRIVADAALTTLTLLVLVRTIFGAGSGGIEWSPIRPLIRRGLGEAIAGADGSAGALTLLSVTVLTLVSVFVGAIAALAVLVDPHTRRDPVGWLLAGCGVAGAGAVLFLTHIGSSQWYFLWTAQAPLSILAAWGLVVVLERTTRPAALAAAGAGVGVLAVIACLALLEPLGTSELPDAAAWLALAVFAALVVTLSLGAARLLPVRLSRPGTTASIVSLVALTVAGVVPAVQSATADRLDPAPATAATPGAFHSEQVEAARWIRDHSEPDDVVLTDRHCRGLDTPTCDRRRFFVAAYSERRVLVEGWAYTDRANEMNAGTEDYSPRRSPFWDPDVLALNDGFVSDPSRSAAGELYRLGVRWIFVDRTVRPPPQLDGVAQRTFTTPKAAVYRLLPDV